MKPTLPPVSLLAQVIPPRHAERSPVALEAAMQSLALSERDPIALEIAGTATCRRFFLRASSSRGYIHALSQLRARYPQAGIVRLRPEDDPLQLSEDEAVSAVELTAGNASYLPLRTWQEEEMRQEGLDPLLGVLAALDGIPEGMRVVAQIGMVPAAPAWSRASQRRAVEHPEERVRLPIIIDEFQTLEGTDYGALAELRKYGATFFLATQSFEYLRRFQPALLATVLANVNQFIIYHMSAEDAEVIHQELAVEPEDIMTLSRHLCYMRLMYQGQRQPVFSVRLNLPVVGDASQALAIRLRSQQRYARPVAEVDEQLSKAVVRALSASPQTGQHEPATPAVHATTSSQAPATDPALEAPPHKKRKGAWVKGGRKNQHTRLTPSAFADTEDTETTGAQDEGEEEPAGQLPDESEEDHEPLL